MEYDEAPMFSGGLRPSDDTAIEESGVLGTRRGWANISRFEIIFLIVAITAAIATDTLTIIRLVGVKRNDADFAFGLLILVNSIFLLSFLFVGIWYQRIAHIIAFCASAMMLTIYVIVHYVARSKNNEPDDSYAKIRLIRLVFTIVFNICFIPLAILVIRDYRRDEFSKRLFGAFPSARRPLKTYNTFDCMAGINTMLSISAFVLNLYNFNSYTAVDIILLVVGIPLALLWLGVGVGMVRLENYILVAVFYAISLFQPGFLGFALYSAITNGPSSTSTTTILTTISTSIITSTSSTATKPFDLDTISALFADTTTTIPPKVLVPVPTALYVCIGVNIFTHISAMVLALMCIFNFGKGLKERVFNNRLDIWCGKYFSRKLN